MSKRFFIHIDADAFFASVEQCLHKELKGKAIVTGRDGSIAVSLSYEAKKLGIQRTMPIHEIRKKFPKVAVVASDYSMYRIYSDRMIAVVKRFIPTINRKSVDECAAEVSDLVNDYHQARDLGLHIQEELETKLGCSFSIGISASPLLAKMASGMNKPGGLTLLSPNQPETYSHLPAREVPGLGRRLSEKLSRYGIITINDFIRKYPLVKEHFSIILEDIYLQMQGIPPLLAHAQKPQKSMNRARSFRPSPDRHVVWGQLMLNYEHLMRKMRQQKLVCSRISLSLRNKERFKLHAHRDLLKKTRDPEIIKEHVERLYQDLWKEGGSYRYVSLTFSRLDKDSCSQLNLFETQEKEEAREKIYSTIDHLDAKFGKATVSLGSTLLLPQALGSRSYLAAPEIVFTHKLLKGETAYRRLRYPFLGKI